MNMSDIRSALCSAAKEKGGEPSNPTLLHQMILKNSEMLDQVLSFCIFEDIGALKYAGKEMKDPLLVDMCGQELFRLGEELFEACFMNNLEELESLLTKKKVPADLVVGDVWQGLRCPLSTATMRGNYHIARRLLLAGADVNWQDENGTTALELAVVLRRNQHTGQLRPLDPGASSSLDETIKILQANGGRIFQDDSDY